MSTPLAAPVPRIQSCLPGTPASVAHARAWLGTWLRALGISGETSASAALVLSELATNAATHSRSAGPGGRYHVHLHPITGALLVSVSDAGGPKHPRPPGCAVFTDPLTESGRGLAVVAHYSVRWWTDGDMHGRTVTAELALE